MGIIKTFIKSCSIDSRNKQNPTCEVVHGTKESSLQTSTTNSSLAQLGEHGTYDFLWSLGFLGTSHPDQLLNTVIFSIGKGFTLCAGQEHRALRGLPFKSQFQFMHDSDGEIFLCYSEDVGTKMNKGGLKHR